MTPDIIIVGGGIQGAFAANRSIDLGMRPLLIDGNPDPRQPYSVWGTGTTIAGGNGRHATRREMTCWATPSRYGFLEIPISQGGMSARPAGEYTNAEREAINAFNNTAVNPDSYWATWNVASLMNEVGLKRWRQLIREVPEFFEGLFQEPVVAFCKGSTLFEKEVDEEQKARSAIEVLDDVQVADRYPSLIQAVRSDQISGGIIQHDSFAVNVISLLGRMLDRVELLRGRVMHNTRVTEVVRENDKVSGIKTDNGIFLEAPYIAAFPGRDGQALVEGTPLKDRMMGVAGAWIAIPRLPIPYPFKVLLTEQPAFVNVTYEGDKSWISGGFGWLGQQEARQDNPELTELMNILKRFMRRVLPEDFQGFVDHPLDARLCVRPSSLSNLTRYHHESTRGGGRYVVAQGDSGGGFVRAPEVVGNVIEYLQGYDHIIVDHTPPAPA